MSSVSPHTQPHSLGALPSEGAREPLRVSQPASARLCCCDRGASARGPRASEGARVRSPAPCRGLSGLRPGPTRPRLAARRGAPREGRGGGAGGGVEVNRRAWAEDRPFDGGSVSASVRARRGRGWGAAAGGRAPAARTTVPSCRPGSAEGGWCSKERDRTCRTWVSLSGRVARDGTRAEGPFGPFQTASSFAPFYGRGPWDRLSTSGDHSTFRRGRGPPESGLLRLTYPLVGPGHSPGIVAEGVSLPRALAHASHRGRSLNLSPSLLRGA